MWRSHTSNHSQKNLVKFDYRTSRTIKKNNNLVTIWQPTRACISNLANLFPKPYFFSKPFQIISNETLKGHSRKLFFTIWKILAPKICCARLVHLTSCWGARSILKAIVTSIQQCHYHIISYLLLKPTKNLGSIRCDHSLIGKHMYPFLHKTFSKLEHVEINVHATRIHPR